MKKKTPDSYLRLHAVGDIPAPYASIVLLRVSRCYTVLRVLEDLAERKPFELVNFFTQYAHDLSTPEPAAVSWLRTDALHLKGVVLQSPGFWEFVGKWNPLEALRLYLNDRHERSKDKSYRNSAEAERLATANQLAKLKVVSQILKMARESGVPENEITIWYREMVLVPFLQLDTIQDKGLISFAEMPERKGANVQAEEPVDA